MSEFVMLALEQMMQDQGLGGTIRSGAIGGKAAFDDVAARPRCLLARP